MRLYYLLILILAPLFLNSQIPGPVTGIPSNRGNVRTFGTRIDILSITSPTDSTHNLLIRVADFGRRGYSADSIAVDQYLWDQSCRRYLIDSVGTVSGTNDELVTVKVLELLGVTVAPIRGPGAAMDEDIYPKTIPGLPQDMQYCIDDFFKDKLSDDVIDNNRYWTETYQYFTNASAVYSGTVYKATADNIGERPDTSSNWVPITTSNPASSIGEEFRVSFYGADSVLTFSDNFKFQADSAHIQGKLRVTSVTNPYDGSNEIGAVIESLENFHVSTRTLAVTDDLVASSTLSTLLDTFKLVNINVNLTDTVTSNRSITLPSISSLSENIELNILFEKSEVVSKYVIEASQGESFLLENLGRASDTYIIEPGEKVLVRKKKGVLSLSANKRITALQYEDEAQLPQYEANVVTFRGVNYKTAKSLPQGLNSTNAIITTTSDKTPFGENLLNRSEGSYITQTIGCPTEGWAISSPIRNDVITTDYNLVGTDTKSQAFAPSSGSNGNFSKWVDFCDQSIQLDSVETLTLSFWFKSKNPIHGISFTSIYLQERPFVTSDLDIISNIESLENEAITNQWKRYEFQLTTTRATQGIGYAPGIRFFISYTANQDTFSMMNFQLERTTKASEYKNTSATSFFEKTDSLFVLPIVKNSTLNISDIITQDGATDREIIQGAIDYCYNDLNCNTVELDVKKYYVDSTIVLPSSINLVGQNKSRFTNLDNARSSDYLTEIIVDFDDPTMNVIECRNLGGNPVGYMGNNIDGIQIKALSPARSAIEYNFPIGSKATNISIESNGNTDRFFEYGISATELDDGDGQALFLEIGYCEIANCKIGIKTDRCLLEVHNTRMINSTVGADLNGSQSRFDHGCGFENLDSIAIKARGQIFSYRNGADERQNQNQGAEYLWYFEGQDVVLFENNRMDFTFVGSEGWMSLTDVRSVVIANNNIGGSVKIVNTSAPDTIPTMITLTNNSISGLGQSIDYSDLFENIPIENIFAYGNVNENTLTGILPRGNIPPANSNKVHAKQFSSEDFTEIQDTLRFNDVYLEGKKQNWFVYSDSLSTGLFSFHQIYKDSIIGPRGIKDAELIVMDSTRSGTISTLWMTRSMQGKEWEVGKTYTVSWWQKKISGNSSIALLARSNTFPTDVIQTGSLIDNEEWKRSYITLTPEFGPTTAVVLRLFLSNITVGDAVAITDIQVEEAYMPRNFIQTDATIVDETFAELTVKDSFLINGFVNMKDTLQVKKIVDSDGDLPTVGQYLTGKAGGVTDWANPTGGWDEITVAGGGTATPTNANTLIIFTGTDAQLTIDDSSLPATAMIKVIHTGSGYCQVIESGGPTTFYNRGTLESSAYLANVNNDNGSTRTFLYQSNVFYTVGQFDATRYQKVDVVANGSTLNPDAEENFFLFTDAVAGQQTHTLDTPNNYGFDWTDSDVIRVTLRTDADTSITLNRTGSDFFVLPNTTGTATSYTLYGAATAQLIYSSGIWLVVSEEQQEQIVRVRIRGGSNTDIDTGVEEDLNATVNGTVTTLTSSPWFGVNATTGAITYQGPPAQSIEGAIEFSTSSGSVSNILYSLGINGTSVTSCEMERDHSNSDSGIGVVRCVDNDANGGDIYTFMGTPDADNESITINNAIITLRVILE